MSFKGINYGIQNQLVHIVAFLTEFHCSIILCVIVYISVCICFCNQFLTCVEDRGP